MNETNLIIITAIQLIMKIIIDGELLVQQRSILRVMKKEITIITKIARILRSPFVIHTHLRSSVYLTYTTYISEHATYVEMSVLDKPLFLLYHPPHQTISYL